MRQLHALAIAALVSIVAARAHAQPPHFGWTTQCQVDDVPQTIAVMNEPATTDATLGMPLPQIACGTPQNPIHTDITILEHRAPTLHTLTVFHDGACTVNVIDELVVRVRTEVPVLSTVDEGTYRAFMYQAGGCYDRNPSMAVDVPNAQFTLAPLHTRAPVLQQLAWYAHSPLVADLDSDMAYVGRLDAGGHTYVEGIDPTSRLWVAENVDGDLVAVATEAGAVAPYAARRTLAGRLAFAGRCAVALAFAVAVFLMLGVVRPRLTSIRWIESLHAPAAYLLAALGFIRGAAGTLVLSAGLFCVATRDEWSGGFLPGPSAEEATTFGTILGVAGVTLVASAAVLVASGVAGLRPSWRSGRIVLWIGVAVVLVPAVLAICAIEVGAATAVGVAISLFELVLFAILLRGTRRSDVSPAAPPVPSRAPT